MFKYHESYEIVLMRPLFPNEKGEVMVNCIFHDDVKPSLAINVKEGLYCCHSCGAKGNFGQFLENVKQASKAKGTDLSKIIDKANHLLENNSSSGFIFSFYMSQKTSLCYEVRKVLSTKNGVKISLDVFCEGDLFFTNTPNLSTSKSRKEFSNKIYKKAEIVFPARYQKPFTITIEDLEDDLQCILERCNARLSNKEESGSPQDEQPTVAEVEISEEFLKNKRLMQEIQADMAKIGIRGEECNRLMVYLACISRLFATPISITVKGSSSSGKSHLVSAILQLMPRSAFFEFSYVSAKALAYMDNVDFRNKILVIYERSGAIESDYNIRVMQSEGKLRIAVPIKDKATGRHQTSFVEIEGPIAYIETTTEHSGHPENETRVYSVFTDESEGQTKKVHEQQKAQYRSRQDISDEEKSAIIRKHVVAQQLLKSYAVTIPYVDLIRFPANKVRLRRDFPRFLLSIAVVTLLHQYQREKIAENGTERLVATLDDYRIAYDISIKALTQSMAELPLRSRSLLKFCRKYSDVFSRNDLVSKAGWSLDEIAKYIRPLIDYNYVVVLRGDKGKTYMYKCVWPGDRNNFRIEGLTTPDELATLVNHNKKKVKKIVIRVALKRLKK